MSEDQKPKPTYNMKCETGKFVDGQQVRVPHETVEFPAFGTVAQQPEKLKDE